MTLPQDPPRPAAPKSRRAVLERVAMLVLVLAAIVLAVLLLRGTRRPGTAAAPAVRLADAGVARPGPRPMPSAAGPGTPAAAPAETPDKPPPPPPNPPQPGAWKMGDGGWVAYKPDYPRNYREFGTTPPTYFVSDEERARFREYWMKEANTRVGIYCGLTERCPDEATVGRLLDSLFDDYPPLSADASPEDRRAGKARWRAALKEWSQVFGETPQSVFSLAALQQHRGPDVPEPPLEPDREAPPKGEPIPLPDGGAAAGGGKP